MALSAFQKMRASAAFDAGYKAAKVANNPFAHGRAARKKAGITTIGGGFFYKQGFDYAKSSVTFNRPRPMGFQAAVEAWDQQRDAEAEAWVAELSMSREVDFDAPDDGPDVEGDVGADDEETPDVGEPDEGGDVEDSADQDDGADEGGGDPGEDDPGEDDPGESDDDDGDSE